MPGHGEQKSLWQSATPLPASPPRSWVRSPPADYRVWTALFCSALSYSRCCSVHRCQCRGCLLQEHGSNRQDQGDDDRRPGGHPGQGVNEATLVASGDGMEG